MKILNRPMFRMGGPIKEGIMNGIQEPKRIGYAVKGTVSAADQAKAFENIFTANTNNMRPVSTLNFEVPNNSILNNNQMTDKNNDGIINQSDYYYDEGQRRKEKGEMFEKFIAPNTTDEFLNTRGYEYKNPNYKKPLDAVSDINIEKARIGMPENISKDMGSKNLPNVKDIIEKKGMSEDTPLTKKERTNNILEMLGYDKAKKNALYDAMIKAGQRISRTGLGADNLVSDVIQDTSTSYDKPEKLREAANLMDVQQQLKLDQIDASKTGGATKQSYDFFIEQGYSKEVAERKARNLPTTISEYFTASKASTDTGKLYDATRAATEEGVFGNVEYKGKIDSTKHKKLSEFLSSEELKSKGDGVYNILGEAVIIVDGQVKSRQVIQPKVDKKGWFD
jgi:hypothetical protein